MTTRGVAPALLAYLLIVLHGWYDWPRTHAGTALAAAGLVVPLMIAAAWATGTAPRVSGGA